MPTLGEGLNTLLLIVLVVIAVIRLRTTQHAQISYAAARLHLRDKGRIGIDDGRGLTCDSCGTFVRVGIDDDGEFCHYCWRCEYIFDYASDEGPDDPGGETIERDTKVIKLPLRRR